VFNPCNKICRIPRNFIVATLSSVTGNEIDANSTQPRPYSNAQMFYSVNGLGPRQTDANSKADSLQRCVERTDGHCKQQTVGRPMTACMDVEADGKVASASCVLTVNTHSHIDLLLAALQENSMQQAETDGSNNCSGSSRPSKQQQAGSTAEAQTPLSEKVEHLWSRGFLIDDCDAIDEAFPDFIDLLYSFQDIFAYSATDITECNLLKCEIFNICRR